MPITRLKIIISVFFIALLICSPIQAAEKITYQPSEWKKEPLYIDRAFGKLNFSFWNFLFGFTKFATKPYEAYMTDENVLLGIGKGILFGVADTAGGLLNGVTFPITALSIPLPEGGIETHEF